MVKESNVQSTIIKRLREIPNSYWVKYHGAGYGHRGVPDIIGVVQGIAFWFEVKVNNNKASDLQQREIDKINASGSFASVVYSWRDCYRDIHGWLKKHNKSCEFVRDRLK